MHFTHYAKALETSILESAQIDPRIRNYSPSTMSSCGQVGVVTAISDFIGLGGWFPGATGVTAPGGGGQPAPAGKGYSAPGGMGATAPGGMGAPAPSGLGAIGLSSSGFGNLVRGRGKNLAGEIPILNG
jgi:hypothetical protein